MIEIIGELCSLLSPASCYEQNVTTSDFADGLDAVLPDGRAAASRVDEAASGRAPGRVALPNRQT
jgi:hypothetical protein